jgi:hypothetical protein
VREARSLTLDVMMSFPCTRRKIRMATTYLHGTVGSRRGMLLERHAIARPVLLGCEATLADAIETLF